MGGLSVLYSELVALVQNQYFVWFQKFPYWLFIVAPLLFICAVLLVRYFAPEAKGSGIPQVLKAIQLSEQKHESSKHFGELVSIRTATIKILSSVFGILSGASVGREGPTVQIAASTFSWIARRTKGWVSHVEFQSYLVAGGAAGVAAAFNTPLAGIAFALEEIGEVKFPKFKENVMLSVIIAGIAAQALAGDYLYFGRPLLDTLPVRIVLDSLLIGALGGLAGGLFGWILSRQSLRFLPNHWLKRAVVCAAACTVINFISGSDTAGSGYEVTRRLMDSTDGTLSVLFVFEKFTTTVLSYLSGMAGGIFSPSLAIGAGLGVLVSKVFFLGSLKICALIGMVAFFAGVVQAPLTAVIIVMEMTDKHVLIIPLMVSAYIAQAVAKKFMPISLYRCLAFAVTVQPTTQSPKPAEAPLSPTL